MRVKPRVKLPIDAFKKCPVCAQSHFITPVGVHVYCKGCGWDSVEAFARATDPYPELLG